MRYKFPENSKGFTLLELIIVLIIIGIIIAVGIPKIFKGIESVKSRSLLSDIVMFLRKTRMDALSSSKTIKVSIKLQEKIFETDNGNTFSIPDDAGVSINVEDEYLYVDVDETSFTFYPNGMASGSKLILSDEDENDKIAVISLDPLTGLANYSMELESQ